MERKPKIAVIGDVMLDVEYHATVGEAAEAPGGVPVYKLGEQRCFPGGAASAAANVASLGGMVDVFGVVGLHDEDGETLRMKCGDYGCLQRLLRVGDRPTTVKNRVYVDGVLHTRFDTEMVKEIEADVAYDLARAFLDRPYQACLISDYGKGVVTAQLLDLIRKKFCTSTVVDPSGDDWAKYAGATVIKANRKEATAAYAKLTGRDDQSIEKMGPELVKACAAGVIVTDGECGVHGFATDGETVFVTDFGVADPKVVGAGDAVAAAVTLAVAQGLDWVTTCKYADAAGRAAVRTGRPAAVIPPW